MSAFKCCAEFIIYTPGKEKGNDENRIVTRCYCNSEKLAFLFLQGQSLVWPMHLNINPGSVIEKISIRNLETKDEKDFTLNDLKFK